MSGHIQQTDTNAFAFTASQGVFRCPRCLHCALTRRSNDPKQSVCRHNLTKLIPDSDPKNSPISAHFCQASIVWSVLMVKNWSRALTAATNDITSQPSQACCKVCTAAFLDSGKSSANEQLSQKNQAPLFTGCSRTSHLRFVTLKSLQLWIKALKCNPLSSSD